MAERKIVELRTAYQWRCKKCGVENFSLPQKVTDERAEAAYRQLQGMNEHVELPANWRAVEVVCVPNDVECMECHTVFDTNDESVSDG